MASRNVLERALVYLAISTWPGGQKMYLTWGEMTCKKQAVRPQVSLSI